VKRIGIKIKYTNFLSLEEGRLNYEDMEWNTAMEHFLDAIKTKSDDHRALYDIAITMMNIARVTDGGLLSEATYFATKALQFHPCKEYEEVLEKIKSGRFGVFRTISSSNLRMLSSYVRDKDPITEHEYQDEEVEKEDCNLQ